MKSSITSLITVLYSMQQIYRFMNDCFMNNRFMNNRFMNNRRAIRSLSLVIDDVEYQSHKNTK